MKKYILKTKRDLDILNSCKRLQKLKLSEKDRDLAALIKTQLERDWRKHLINKLNQLEKKYNNQIKSKK